MLKIGSVILDNLALPEEWKFGGKQHFAIHEMPGGSIVYQPRGNFNTLINSWQGELIGSNAFEKARQLDKYRRAAKSVEVNFHTFRLLAFIEEFTWSWLRKNVIEFSITLIRDFTPQEQKKAADPVAKVVASVVTEPPSKPKQRIHVVVKGEWLRSISRHYYQTPDKWEVIYNANKSVIGTNPDLILAGQKLVIP